MTQSLQIRPSRNVALTPDAQQQRLRYLEDADLRERLAKAIEAEAAALNQISDGQALWIADNSGVRVECALNTLTRQIVVTVKLPGEDVVVMDDGDAANVIYNRPDTARWPDAIISQHEAAQAKRDVMAEQKRMAENAKELKRQGMI